MTRTAQAGKAIARMRQAGIRVPLLIDAAGWGRHVEQLLRTAPALIRQDPDANLVFSWHAWDTAGDQTARVTASLEQAVAQDIPLIIGFPRNGMWPQGVLSSTTRVEI